MINALERREKRDILRSENCPIGNLNLLDVRYVPGCGLPKPGTTEVSHCDNAILLIKGVASPLSTHLLGSSVSRKQTPEKRTNDAQAHLTASRIGEGIHRFQPNNGSHEPQRNHRPARRFARHISRRYSCRCLDSIRANNRPQADYSRSSFAATKSRAGSLKTRASGCNVTASATST